MKMKTKNCAERASKISAIAVIAFAALFLSPQNLKAVPPDTEVLKPFKIAYKTKDFSKSKVKQFTRVVKEFRGLFLKATGKMVMQGKHSGYVLEWEELRGLSYLCDGGLIYDGLDLLAYRISALLSDDISLFGCIDKTLDINTVEKKDLDEFRLEETCAQKIEPPYLLETDKGSLLLIVSKQPCMVSDISINELRLYVFDYNEVIRENNAKQAEEVIKWAEKNKIPEKAGKILKKIINPFSN